MVQKAQLTVEDLESPIKRSMEQVDRRIRSPLDFKPVAFRFAVPDEVWFQIVPT